jgi:hypothetical protein
VHPARLSAIPAGIWRRGGLSPSQATGRPKRRRAPLRTPAGAGFEELAQCGPSRLSGMLGVAAEKGLSLERETVVYQEIGAVLGLRATHRIATSALPCAPVLAEPKRRHLARRLLRGALLRGGQ